MSIATKRKHVMRSVLTEDPELPSENQSIVRVRASVGNNLHEVETSEGETYLVSMPTRFRKSVWVKRGDFILVEPIPEGDKVRAEMVRPLPAEHIRFLRKNSHWPTGFEEEHAMEDFNDGNPNHRPLNTVYASDSSSSSDDSFDHNNEKEG